MLHIILECIAIAFGAGLVYGVFGGGSGLIMMPGYYYLMRHFSLVTSHQMQVAVGTTALTSGILGSVAAYKQYKSGHVNFGLVKKMAPGILIGTVLAIFLLNIVPSHFLKKLFGVVVILVAAWLLMYRMEKDLKHWSLDGTWNLIRSTVIGLLWFLLGVAVFNVPYLHKCQIQIREAVGSATFMGGFFSFLAGLMLMVGGYFTVGASSNHIGYVNLLLCAISIIPSALAAFIGASISVRLPQKIMKIVYSCLIFVVGALMLFA